MKNIHADAKTLAKYIVWREEVAGKAPFYCLNKEQAKRVETIFLKNGLCAWIEKVNDNE